ncbi:glycosyltransferase family A protein [Synechococcus sp. CC9311]|uniref:glycosyltransferase family 2 protein n=1 Tax=Synechococcus sp. (strain CC9311) TaxID=64471 RepID=UPI0000DDA99D|nr:glycosyltransferase family A protein [Synechococcus sp. CC9311]ABI46949.1 putative glycosyl transferase [Synechococcus sp. CC9311]
MASPRFSIITPVLNGARDVYGYIETLKKQKFSNWESIIVDDGSSDGTTDILDDCIAGDKRFYVFCNTLVREISGPYQARNFGLKLAQGDFICFLDIDDRWFPNKLEMQAKQLKSNPEYCLLYSPYVRGNRGASFGKVRKTPLGIAPKLLVKVSNPIPMLTSCVSRATISDLFFAPVNHEDYLFWHFVISRLNSEQIAEYPNPLAIYCVDPSSISGNKFLAFQWLWRCYKRLGYGFFATLLVLFLRGMLQVFFSIKEYISPRVEF